MHRYKLTQIQNSPGIQHGLSQFVDGWHLPYRQLSKWKKKQPNLRFVKFSFKVYPYSSDVFVNSSEYTALKIWYFQNYIGPEMKCVVSACLEDYHLFKARRDMSSIVFYFFSISAIWRFLLRNCKSIFSSIGMYNFNWKYILWLYKRSIAFRMLLKEKNQNIIALNIPW